MTKLIKETLAQRKRKQRVKRIIKLFEKYKREYPEAAQWRIVMQVADDMKCCKDTVRRATIQNGLYQIKKDNQ